MTIFTNIGIIQIRYKKNQKKNRKEHKTMKKQDFTQKSKIKKTNSAVKFFTLFLLIVIFLTLSVGISANNTFRVENCNKCEEYSEQLGKEINSFIELDNEPTKAVSTQVTSAINEYRKRIIDLQSHPEIEKRSLENEILLAYTQGNTAGQLAWIYYYNVYTFNSNISADKITAKYVSCQSRIANAEQHSVLSAECSVMADELNRLIYTERAKNLALPEDSLTASSLISGTVETFKNIYSPDLFGNEYAKEYSSLTQKLGLQRVRDVLKSEAEAVFKLIVQNNSFNSSPTASLLIYELENAESIKKMNAAMITFIEELLAIDESKPYSLKAKSKYLSQSQTAASRATESQTAAKFLDIFNDYALSIKKAEIKDSVYFLLLGNTSTNNQELLELEAKFNGEGGIIDSCQNDSEVEAALVSAKSQLFIHKHNSIISKGFDELTLSDEELAKAAFIEYSALEEKVKQELLSEINIIAEKYNNILIIKIRSYSPNDALYLDYCEIIANEIKSVSRNNIDDFYNKVSRIPQKAEALCKALQEYRSILASENFKGYIQSEKDALLAVLSELSSSLSKIDPADIAIYSDEIADAQSTAIRKLNITDQSARVRIATRFSKNAEVIKELNTAYEKIALCTEKSEMATQANRAIYKIERLLTSDAIINNCEKLKSDISSAQFLKESEKSNFISQISKLENKAKEAKEAENITVLESIWTTFSNELNTVRAEAEAIDLSRAITEYIKRLAEASKSRLDTVKALEYISEDKCDEICNKINTEENKAKQDIPLCKSSAEVVSYYQNFVKKLDDLVTLANQEDLLGYKDFLMTKFDMFEKIKANYSVENYNKILAVKDSTKQKLTSASSKSECDSIINSAINEVLQINDLLDDEKENALSSLLNLLEDLKKSSPLYSAQSFSKIEGFYGEAKIEIAKINDIANIALVKQTLSKYISLIKSINKDSIYTSSDAHNISTPALQYPSDFNYSNGLHGSIHLANGLVSDANFSIELLNQARNKEIENLIRKSAKKGLLLSSEPLPEKTVKLLRSAAVAATLDISLSSVVENASGYTVQMLIPNNLLSENILGLAFVKGNQVEFYPINQADSLISAKLDHFSKYYIIVESTLNVKPFLIALIVLLVIEFLILISIIYLRYKRKDDENDENDGNGKNQIFGNLPNLPMSALIPFFPALARIYPENGLSLAILLSIAAIALGATIMLLIRKDVKNNRTNSNLQKQLKGRENQLLLGKGEVKEHNEEEFFSSNEELCVVGARAKSNTNKAEIDLDIIAENFKSGDIVNLNALIAKGIVAEDVNYIKILTKGNLTKALTIEANEFSNAALDVLELSGGEAIKIEKQKN